MTSQADSLTFRPMDEAGARAIIAWRYEPPYNVYQIDPTPDEIPSVIAFLIDPQNAYFLIENAVGEIEAFCCFGDDAQVPGGDYPADALDLGLGLRPDLTGQGRGHQYAAAVADFARSSLASAALRVTIAGFNQRAQRAWERAGFRPAATFASVRDGMPFVILIAER